MRTLYVNLRGDGQNVPLDPHEVLGSLLASVGVTADAQPSGAGERAKLLRSVTHPRRLFVLLDNAAVLSTPSASRLGPRER